MTSKQRHARDQAIRAAMGELVHDTRFTQFINVVREQREAAIDDLCSDRVMADERLVMAAVGEIRSLKSIIAAYDEFLDRAENEQPRDTDGL